MRPPTERELEVLLTHVVQGGTIEETAHRMGLSPQTVKNVLAKVRRKLDARSTAQAYHRAMQNGKGPQ